jgi:putative glutamine amidotransferase
MIRVRHRRPVIGLSTYDDVVSWYAWENKAATLIAEVYLSAVSAGGGAPILLPSIVDPGEVIDRIDAIVLVGGPDVNARRYGGESHVLSRTSSDRRDEFELGLIHAAGAISLPLLGICRGAQLLNVAHNGTLHQHIPELLGHQGHSPGSGRYGTTAVEVRGGSRLAAALGVATFEVDCFHHQAIDTLGDGLEVSARADDGTIEAIEDPDAEFVVGVQWHPEEGSDLRLFEALIDAAERWRSERIGRYT